MLLRHGIPVTTGSTYSHRIEAGGFRVASARFPAIVSSPHIHEHAVCTVILDGFLQQVLGERGFDCGAGWAVAKPAGARHIDRIQAGTRLVVIEVATDGEALIQPYSTLFTEPHHVRDDRVLPIAWTMARELAIADPFTATIVEGLVLELLGNAVRRASGTSSDRPAWLERARELIHEEFHSNLHVVDLARAVDVHPVRLARGFRTYFGLSPGEYLRRVRLEWAARELITTKRSLADIAARGGFADQSHFTRAFRRHTGLTPARFRRSRGKEPGAAY